MTSDGPDGVPADGPLTRATSLASGTTIGGVREHLRSGNWHRVRRGTYLPDDLLAAAHADPAAQHALAVQGCLLHVGEAVASGTSAAQLHALPLLSPPSPAVELTRPYGSLKSYPGLRIKVAGLPASHLTRCRGLPVTTVARTVVDLARTLALPEAVAVADAALHASAVTMPALAAVLSDCAGWPGVRLARRTIDLADAAAESPLESLARVCFAEHGVEPPLSQHWLGDTLGPIGRVDFHWPAHRTVVETDGLAKYTDPTVLREEKLRQERLKEAGFVVVRFTWSDITGKPARSVARLRAAFARSDALRLASQPSLHPATAPVSRRVPAETLPSAGEAVISGAVR